MHDPPVSSPDIPELGFMCISLCVINIIFLILQLATDAACGNGFLEDGEQCDCGTLEVTEHQRIVDYFSLKSFPETIFPSLGNTRKLYPICASEDSRIAENNFFVLQHFKILFRTVNVLTTLAAIILRVCCMSQPSVRTELAVVTVR